MMRTIILCCALLCIVANCYGQINCNIYKWKNDTMCFHACEKANAAADLTQGSKQSQMLFDTAISLCPSFEYAYYEKAVPYLKRGDFITWETLIDKAVLLNPLQYLGIRAWCSYKFLRNYEGAIDDINKLHALSSWSDIGFTGDGDYHLFIIKGLCYKALGYNVEAIRTIERQLSTKDYSPRAYDYLHLGVLKLESKDYTGAVAAFKKEIEINDYLAETYYYLAIANKNLRDTVAFHANIAKAKEFYAAGKKMTDPYIDPTDKVYEADINTAMDGMADKVPTGN